MDDVVSLRKLDDGITIHHVASAAEADAFRAGFVDAYREIFARPPYLEDFTFDEAEQIYNELVSAPGHVTLVATSPAGAVVGFAAAVPLTSCPNEARLLTGIVPLKHTMYLAELGVSTDGAELSKELTRLRLQLVDHERYSHVVLRVSEGPVSSYDFYRSLQFKDTGVSMSVHRRRTDGEVRSDERTFLSRVLSQVSMDDGDDD